MGRYLASVVLRVLNATFSGNFSESSYQDSFGTRIYAREGGAVYGTEQTGITNSTFVGHDKSSSTVGGSTPVKVKNSLFAENRFESPTNTIADLGHNLNSESEPQFSHPNSLNNAKVKLGPLGEYGGQTPVYPLLQGSVAIDAADDSAAPATDQRGRARPYGAHSDIGAFESSAPFYIWGKIQGYVDPSTEIVMAGVTYAIDEDGNFNFGPLSQGIHNAIFSATNAQFRPENFIVSATVDGPIAGTRKLSATHDQFRSLGIGSGVCDFRSAWRGLDDRGCVQSDGVVHCGCIHNPEHRAGTGFNHQQHDDVVHARHLRSAVTTELRSALE